MQFIKRKLERRNNAGIGFRDWIGNRTQQHTASLIKWLERGEQAGLIAKVDCTELIANGVCLGKPEPTNEEV